MRFMPPLREAWRFDAPRWLDAQMEVLDRNMPSSLMFSVMTSWLTAACFHWVLNDDRVSIWSAFITLVAASGWYLRRRLPTPGAGLGHSPMPYAVSMRIYWGVMGLGWGLLGVLFIEPANPVSNNIVLAVIGGMASGGLAVFAPSWQIAMVYWVAMVLPVALSLIYAHGAINFTLGIGALLYLWAMTVYSYETSRAALRSIALRFENEGLVQRLRDQTQRAHEARQLAEEALGEAEQANRAKAVFMAAASHDLRQPLHATGLFMGALARESLTDRQRHLLGQSQASAVAAGEMLNTLMDFSKVDAGVIKPQPCAFALQRVFHRLQREVAPMAEEKGLAFRLRDTEVVAHADPALVEMIVRNLVLNAIRYTERGAVLLACRRHGGRAVIEVWDTGMGIPAQQHQAIFKEFHQLGNPERDRRKGLGLGLAIVQGLARAMGVDVSLDSRPGRGSVFRLTLPLGQLEGVAEEAAALVLHDLHGLRVLLIEDDECVLAAMAELMGAWGCVCVAVSSGEEALSALSSFVPDVVVSDYRLRSHRTGVQAVASVNARLGRVVPAVIITGDTVAERLREAHASGLVLLHKPVPSEQLQAALVSLSGRGVPCPESAARAG